MANVSFFSIFSSAGRISRIQSACGGTDQYNVMRTKGRCFSAELMLCFSAQGLGGQPIHNPVSEMISFSF